MDVSEKVDVFETSFEKWIFVQKVYTFNFNGYFSKKGISKSRYCSGKWIFLVRKCIFFKKVYVFDFLMGQIFFRLWDSELKSI